MNRSTISQLQKYLGPGLGLRKNRYTLELPVPGVTGETLNILCQSAGLPERTISTTELWHKGRKYQIRGETDFSGEYEISIVDDSEMQIRQMFDTWLKLIDNSRPDKNDSLLGASYEVLAPGAMGELERAVAVGNTIKNAAGSERQAADFVIGMVDSNLALPNSKYQVDANIWQMDRRGNQVYGYKLQNAFPKSVGIVTLGDGEENSMSEFSVNLAFSEFIPIRGIKEDLARAVLGDQTTDIAQGAAKLAGIGGVGGADSIAH